MLSEFLSLRQVFCLSFSSGCNTKPLKRTHNEGMEQPMKSQILNMSYSVTATSNTSLRSIDKCVRAKLYRRISSAFQISHFEIVIAKDSYFLRGILYHMSCFPNLCRFHLDSIYNSVFKI